MKTITFKSSLLVLVITLLLGCSDDRIGGRWHKSTPMQMERQSHGFIECGGLLYAIGGYNTEILSSVEAFDPETEVWLSKPEMPTPRALMVTACIDNKIYAVGGMISRGGGNTYYTTANEVYDPVSNTWSSLAPLPFNFVGNGVEGNYYICGGAINGKIYVAGHGRNNSSTMMNMYIYDPQNDTWEEIQESLEFFNFDPYSSAVVGSDLYVSDGRNFMKYRSDLKLWQELLTFETPIQQNALASDGNFIYSAGGLDNQLRKGSSTLTKVQAFSLSDQKWIHVRPLSANTRSGAMLYYNNTLYLSGGAFEEIHGNLLTFKLD
jgi:N-acetylneuraminic acid mutarotase